MTTSASGLAAPTGLSADDGARWERIRLLYQLPVAGATARLLVVGNRGSELSRGWPGDVEVWPLDQLAARLQQGDPGAFDVVAIPGLLSTGGRVGIDGLAGAPFFAALSRRLAPGGVLAGDVRRSWASRRGPAPSGVRSLRATLERGGLVDIECYFVRPSMDDPMALIPADTRAARAHFQRQLACTRPQFTALGYALRRMAVTCGLGARNHPSIFFWARRPC